MNEREIKRGLVLILFAEVVLSCIPFTLSMILTTNTILQITTLSIPILFLAYKLKSWGLI